MWLKGFGGIKTLWRAQKKNEKNEGKIVLGIVEHLHWNTITKNHSFLNKFFDFFGINQKFYCLKSKSIFETFFFFRILCQLNNCEKMQWSLIWSNFVIFIFCCELKFWWHGGNQKKLSKKKASQEKTTQKRVFSLMFQLFHHF